MHTSVLHVPTNSVTPWAQPGEWLDVNACLWSASDEAAFSALRTIADWKAVDQLPHAVESTLQLFQARYADLGTYQNTAGSSATHERDGVEEQVALAYGMAITRFVNGITEELQTTLFAKSVASLARKVGLARELVDIRHDVTHNATPSLDALRNGTQAALDWLRHNYWQPQQQMFDNLVDGSLASARLRSFEASRLSDEKWAVRRYRWRLLSIHRRHLGQSIASGADIDIDMSDVPLPPELQPSSALPFGMNGLVSEAVPLSDASTAVMQQLVSTLKESEDPTMYCHNTLVPLLLDRRVVSETAQPPGSLPSARLLDRGSCWLALAPRHSAPHSDPHQNQGFITCVLPSSASVAAADAPVHVLPADTAGHYRLQCRWVPLLRSLQSVWRPFSTALLSGIVDRLIEAAESDRRRLHGQGRVGERLEGGSGTGLQANGGTSSSHDERKLLRRLQQARMRVLVEWFQFLLSRQWHALWCLPLAYVRPLTKRRRRKAQKRNQKAKPQQHQDDGATDDDSLPADCVSVPVLPPVVDHHGSALGRSASVLLLARALRLRPHTLLAQGLQQLGWQSDAVRRRKAAPGAQSPSRSFPITQLAVYHSLWYQNDRSIVNLFTMKPLAHVAAAATSQRGNSRDSEGSGDGEDSGGENDDTGRPQGGNFVLARAATDQPRGSQQRAKRQRMQSAENGSSAGEDSSGPDSAVSASGDDESLLGSDDDLEQLEGAVIHDGDILASAPAFHPLHSQTGDTDSYGLYVPGYRWPEWAFQRMSEPAPLLTLTGVRLLDAADLMMSSEDIAAEEAIPGAKTGVYHAPAWSTQAAPSAGSSEGFPVFNWRRRCEGLLLRVLDPDWWREHPATPPDSPSAAARLYVRSGSEIAWPDSLASSQSRKRYPGLRAVAHVAVALHKACLSIRASSAAPAVGPGKPDQTSWLQGPEPAPSELLPIGPDLHRAWLRLREWDGHWPDHRSSVDETGDQPMDEDVQNSGDREDAGGGAEQAGTSLDELEALLGLRDNGLAGGEDDEIGEEEERGEERDAAHSVEGVRVSDSMDDGVPTWVSVCAMREVAGPTAGRLPDASVGLPADGEAVEVEEVIW